MSAVWYHHPEQWNPPELPPSPAPSSRIIRRDDAAIAVILETHCEPCPHSVAGDHDKLGCRRVSPNGCCPGKLRAHLADGGGCPEKLFGEVL